MTQNVKQRTQILESALTVAAPFTPLPPHEKQGIATPFALS